MRREPAATFLWVVVAAAALGAVASPASAQSWMPAAGEGTVSVSYENYYLTGHYSVLGQVTPNGATHSKTVAAELEYGITDRLAILVSLPYIASRYTGPRPSYFVAGRETFPGPLDDGTYHGSLQDLRVEARLGFTAGPLSVAPLVAVVIPTHDYETVGEAVPGRHRREVQIGTNAGMLLDPVLPEVYVHVRYALAIAEVILGYPAVRSTIDLEAGRPITRWLEMRGIARWQLRHDAPAPAEFFDAWVIHDRFMVASYTNLGGGLTISVTPTTELYAVWMSAVSGKYGAHISRLLSVGLTRSFGGRFKGFGASSEPARPPIAAR